jgi:hypothetical protein
MNNRRVATEKLAGKFVAGRWQKTARTFNMRKRREQREAD